jgi:hypothetical protein
MKERARCPHPYAINVQIKFCLVREKESKPLFLLRFMSRIEGAGTQKAMYNIYFLSCACMKIMKLICKITFLCRHAP